MKKAVFFLFATLSVVYSFGQSNFTTVDFFDSKLESVWKSPRMPCTWVVTPQRRANGKLAFVDSDSSKIEFDFYELLSLPFFDSTQSDLETNKQFLKWCSSQIANTPSLSLKTIEENEETGFVIIKLKEGEAESYRIFGRNKNMACSLRMVDKKMQEEEQIEKLRLLYSLNKN